MRSAVLEIVAAIVLISGCASTPQKFTMYPTVLKDGDTVEPDMAVVLVGVQGPWQLDYLQFGHGSLPAINVRFPPQGDLIIAVPLPVGLSNVRLMTVTVAGRPAGYVGSIPVGFVGVHTPPVQLSQPGLYYIATINPAKPQEFATAPLPEQLNAFRKRFPAIASQLQPMSFQWVQ